MKTIFRKYIKPFFLTIRPWIIFSGMLLLLVYFIAFAEKSLKEKTCKGIKIRFFSTDKNRFLTEKEALVIINDAADGYVLDRKISDINLAEIEGQLEKNPFVKKSEVYTKLNDTLYADIYFRKPILRIMSITGDNYYLDENGEHMNWSPNHTAKVLIASGYITDTPDFTADKCLFNMAEIIRKDTFLNALIGQIYVSETRQKNYISKEFLIIPRFGDLKIELGNSDDLEMKFKKLKLFYKNVFPVMDREKYKTINLNFKNQIILK